MANIRFLDSPSLIHWMKTGEVALTGGSTQKLVEDKDGCTLCETTPKPIKMVQLKSRMYRPIPPSKHRSKRILKKLQKRQQLMAEPLIVQFNMESLLVALEGKKPTFEGIIDEHFYLKRTWEIDFNEPYDTETRQLIFRFEAHAKKSFKEIELFDIRDRTKVNNNRVVILRDGEKVRYLKGEVYAKPDLHKPEVKAQEEVKEQEAGFSKI